MRITNYIFLSFLFILLLFSVTTYINFQLSEAVNENVKYVAKSTEITKNTGRFQRNILNMVSGLRGYLLTGEKYFVESYDSAVKENTAILHDLSLIVTDSTQVQLLNEIRALNEKWIEEYTDPLRQAKALATINDSTLAAFKKLYREKLAPGYENQLQQKLQTNFKDFANYEYDLRTSRSKKLAESVSSTKRISFILIILSAVGAFAIIIFLIRQISKRILKMVGMADTIASGNYNTSMQDAGNDELTPLVHSLNHMANELAINIATLEAKNKELDQFAHIVSHDLKGPLRGIDNVIKWIEEDHQPELSPKIYEYLQTIKGRVVRAENLIQGILSYARIDTEDVELEEVDVNLLIQEVKDNLPQKTNITISNTQLPVLYTQKLLLFQIFSNLIDNGIKYNDKPNVEINIYFEEHPDYYEFFVADNGPGIAETYHQRIFVIFQTLKDRDSFESTGVGLAIVKKILDTRKEAIRVTSEPGNGSVFSFTWSKKENSV